jgi:hypothetical protein
LERSYKKPVKSLATVLIAEEDSASAGEMRLALAQARPAWPVVSVSNGEHAMAYLRGLQRGHLVGTPLTTLLLLSVTIPQVTAHQILDWAARQHFLRSLVVALICTGAPLDFERYGKYGARAVLTRPVLASQIGALVAAIGQSAPVLEPRRGAIDLHEAPGQVSVPNHIEVPHLQPDRVLLTHSPPALA